MATFGAVYFTVDRENITDCIFSRWKSHSRHSTGIWRVWSIDSKRERKSRRAKWAEKRVDVEVGAGR